MSFKNLSIYLPKKNSQTIAREKMLMVYNEVSLQFYQANNQKSKIINLFCEIRTHRVILEDKHDSDKYFEIHFDKIVNEIEPIMRGFWNKIIYKLKIVYDDKSYFELKNPSRSSFHELYEAIKRAYLESKHIVFLLEKGSFVNLRGILKVIIIQT